MVCNSHSVILFTIIKDCLGGGSDIWIGDNSSWFQLYEVKEFLWFDNVEMWFCFGPWHYVVAEASYFNSLDQMQDKGLIDL